MVAMMSPPRAASFHRDRDTPVTQDTCGTRQCLQRETAVERGGEARAGVDIWHRQLGSIQYAVNSPPKEMTERKNSYRPP
ncbi:hypothetical protein J6590_012419 [Homalodisca vitripennis]|nr:hypothetical protein J6590_012419 [Homalodisca vitripennis]